MGYEKVQLAIGGGASNPVLANNECVGMPMKPAAGPEADRTLATADGADIQMEGKKHAPFITDVVGKRAMEMLASKEVPKIL